MSAASRIAACLKSVDFEVFGKVQGEPCRNSHVRSQGAWLRIWYFISAGVFFRKVSQTWSSHNAVHVEYDLTHTHTRTLPVHSPESTRVASGWMGEEHGKIDSGGCGTGRGEAGGSHVSELCILLSILSR